MSIDHLNEGAKAFYVTQAKIDSTHPVSTDTPSFPHYDAAAILVGERHGKGDLITLVGHLLYRLHAPAVPAVQPVMAGTVQKRWSDHELTGLKPMTRERAAYFMRRFCDEEKLLGPNEHAAVEFVLELLAAPVAPVTEREVPHIEFIDSVIEVAFEGGNFDGGTIQEWAEKAGLLEARTMTEPCTEDQRCRCAVDCEFPLTCYQKTYRTAPTPPEAGEKS